MSEHGRAWQNDWRDREERRLDLCRDRPAQILRKTAGRGLRRRRLHRRSILREARRAARGKGEPGRYGSLIGPEEVPAMPRRIAQDAPFMVLQSAVRTQGTAIGMPLAGMRSACCNSFQQRRWERLGPFAQIPTTGTTMPLPGRPMPRCGRPMPRCFHPSGRAGLELRRHDG